MNKYIPFKSLDLGKSARYGIIIFVGLCIFFTSFWLSISSSMLTPWVEQTINEQLPPNIKIDIQSADTRIWGIELEKVRIIEQAKRVEWARLDRVDLNTNFFSILFSFGLPFDLELYDGEIDGVFRFIPGLSVSISGENIKFAQNPFLKKLKMIQSNPNLQFEAAVSLEKPMSGKVDLSIDNLQLNGKTDITNLPFELPLTKLTQLKADLLLENNDMKVEVTSKGDIAINLSGNIKANLKRIERSVVDLNLTANLEKSYHQKLGFVKQILRSYQKPTGEIRIQLKGSLFSPSIKRL